MRASGSDGLFHSSLEPFLFASGPSAPVLPAWGFRFPLPAPAPSGNRCTSVRCHAERCSSCGVGFQRRGVNRDRLSLDQSFDGQYPDYPLENSLVRLQPVKSTRPRNGRVIRSLLVQREANKPPQDNESASRHAMPRSDPDLRSNQSAAPENIRPATCSVFRTTLLVKLPAKRFHLTVELVRFQN